VQWLARTALELAAQEEAERGAGGDEHTERTEEREESNVRARSNGAVERAVAARHPAYESAAPPAAPAIPEGATQLWEYMFRECVSKLGVERAFDILAELAG
jgi:hypothetical protein